APAGRALVEVPIGARSIARISIGVKHANALLRGEPLEVAIVTAGQTQPVEVQVEELVLEGGDGVLHPVIGKVITRDLDELRAVCDTAGEPAQERIEYDPVIAGNDAVELGGDHPLVVRPKLGEGVERRQPEGIQLQW